MVQAALRKSNDLFFGVVLALHIDLSPALAVKVSKVLGRSAESWMAMQANHTLARYQVELEQWMPTKQVTAEGLVTVFVRG